MSDGPGWVCGYKGELTIVGRVTESDARGRARSPGNFNKDGPMSSSDDIYMVRPRELREEFGFNTECDLPNNATELSEIGDLSPPDRYGRRR